MISNKVTLVDVSFWQDDDETLYKIDFSIMWSRGIDGAICRAGQNRWMDEDFRDYVNNCIKANMPWGAYWFYDSRVPPEAQAMRFQEVMAGLPVPPLGVWGDYEEHYGGAWGGAAHFKVFMQELQTRFPNTVVGVYTGPSYWIEHTTAAQRDWFKQFPLWIAHYKVPSPTIHAPWSDYLIWQYTEKGDGKYFGVESFDLDLDLFNGDLEDYKRFFGLDWYVPGTEQPQGEEGMFDVWSDTNNMSLRYSNTINSNVKEYIPRGTMMKADRIEAPISGGLAGDKWAHIIEAGGVAKEGWVAVIHNGVTYCTTRPVPTEGGLPTITFTMAAEGYPTLTVEWKPNE